jgi:hypothetical protein
MPTPTPTPIPTPTPTPGIDDAYKQQEILSMVNSNRGTSPTELVLAIMRQESGEGAFHIDGWRYNWFYNESDAPWAQPTNGDGVMQVTIASGYHEVCGPYSHTREGYNNAICDGCSALSRLYGEYGAWVQSALHYNTGPFSLWLNMGDKNEDGIFEEWEIWGDRQYLSNVATQLDNFVPAFYDLQNETLMDALNLGQSIYDDYLYNRGIETGQPLEYYNPYQTALDQELHNL